MDIKGLKTALPYLFKAKITPLIWGRHAIGKSQALSQFCDENAWMLKNIRLGQCADAADIMGLFDYIKDKNGNNVASTYLMPKYLHDLIEFCKANPDKGAIVFYDELNRIARKDLMQAIFEPILDRKLHEIVFPPNLYPVCAANPDTEDYIVLNMDDAAFLSRFAQIKLAPPKKEWFEHAREEEYDPDMIDFLATQDKFLEGDTVDFQISDKVNPDRRAWSAIDRLIKVETPISVLKEIAFGMVGVPATMSYIDFLNNRKDKPFTAEEILKTYSKIKSKVKKYANAKTETGGRQDILHASCENLLAYIEKLGTKKLTAHQGANMMTFLKDIPAELGYDLGGKLYFKETCRTFMDKDIEYQNKIREARGFEEVKNTTKKSNKTTKKCNKGTKK